MLDLYRLYIGPVNAAYYQQHFQRFESMGKATPTWNHGAAFFTLAWLLLRKMWRPAAMYAALVAALLALWWWGIHGRVPLPIETSACLLAVLMLCAVPGFFGNALYFHHAREQTLATLTRAASLSQARVQLAEQATTKERLHAITGAQTLAAATMAAAVWTQVHGWSPVNSAPSQDMGPPSLVIPSPSSVTSGALQALTPTAALAQPIPAQEPPPDTATLDAPADTTPSSEDLAVVALAQSVAAPSAASAPAPTQGAATAPSTSAPPSQSRPNAPAGKSVQPVPVSVSMPPNAVPVIPRLQPGKFYLNAGVYAQKSNVDAAVKKLHAAQMPTLRQVLSSKNGDMTRLRVGPFDTAQQAEQAAAKAQKMHIPASVFQHPQ